MIDKQQQQTRDISGIRLRIASPEEIRRWSYGEVTRPETINYRTQKPEKDGLFSERIFGPTKDWECYCGKYKKIRYRGIICDKCGVEVTRSIVRRERMGHIELAAPVGHLWFLRTVPSKMGLLLDVSLQDLEKVLYFGAFIITEVNEQLRSEAEVQVRDEQKSKRKEIEETYKRKGGEIQGTPEDAKFQTKLKQLASEKEKELEELDENSSVALKELQDLKPLEVISESTYHDLSLKYGHIFEAGIGAEALRMLLQTLDLKKMEVGLQAEYEESSGAKREKTLRRLKLAKNLNANKIRPEWTILTVLPIIPPDLRPMVPLDGGRFATSDLNDLYRRIINRNNRLKQLLELNAPEVIIRNEKRMLQEAVDALIDNGARRGKATMAATGQRRPLKSLADILRGKEGRFRQNLLGKRVDYSGRSVIVVGPELKLHQCGLPKKMALELFKPFVIGRLIRDGLVHNIRSASRFIESGRPEIWQILEEIVADSPVLLNRAPTLHRLGIQAFYPILIEGRAIRIHPLVCPAFNADFDGDQMAVHVPLTDEAKQEARTLMLSSNNLLKPATGDPVVTPTQDLVWGIYYMTKEPDHPKEPKFVSDPAQAKTLFEQDVLRLDDPIKLPSASIPRWEGKEEERFGTTSVGRILFNELLPQKISFQNATIGKGALQDILKLIIEYYGFATTAIFLDDLKEMSLEHLTRSGNSWGIDDLPMLPKKAAILEEAEKKVEEIRKLWEEGYLTASEKRNKTTEVWIETKEKIVKIARESFASASSVLSMVISGARGSWTQLTQIVGMKGLVTNPAGEIIELPVKSSFQEGFSVLEYFISSHGARKGLSDTALRTANAGYLTRRLVDVAQDVVIKAEDCGDTEGFVWHKEDTDEFGKNLSDIIFGRFLAKDLKDLKGKKIAKAGELMTAERVRTLKTKHFKELTLRTALTCLLTKGICQKCYGYDLGLNEVAKIGTAAGIVAAQSIGEPGTQLTMRTFHTGGVVGLDITQGLPRVEELFEARPPKQKAVIAPFDGTIEIREQKVPYQKLIVMKGKDPKDEEVILPVTPGVVTWVKDGQAVAIGDQLSEGSLDLHEVYKYKGRIITSKYLMREIQNIYSSQGQKIDNKHLEIIVRQMFSRMYITDAGETDLMTGETVEKSELLEENERIGKAVKAKGEELLLGVTRVALTTRSFLSAASFQETSRVLTNAAVSGKIDRLEGLKENVIIGRKIPAGTGFEESLKA